MISIKKKLIILGAGNFAEEVLEVALESGHDVICFVEGINPKQCGRKISGIPVIWIDDLVNFDNSHYLLSGIGSTKRKDFIKQASQFEMDFTNVIHSGTHISSKVQLGKDIFINAGTIISTSCLIGNHVLINRASLIGHHVSIENFVTISPGANIGGGSSIGEGSFIGMGAIILDHITVGRNSIIGAGAVVTKNVPDSVQVMGIPARITKEL